MIREFHQAGTEDFDNISAGYIFIVQQRMDFFEPIIAEYSYTDKETAIQYGKQLSDNGYVVTVLQEIAFNTNPTHESHRI